MTASYNFIIDSGTVVADTSDLLADVQSEFQAALGASIDLAASTPQGTLIAAETIARTSVMKNSADLANTINPNLSYGVFLDAICALLGVQRGQNAATIATGVLLTGDGTNTVTVPAGSRIQTLAGDLFSLIADATIVDGGELRADFASEEYGDIPMEVGTTDIVDGTIGWGSAIVDATTVVTPGTVALTDSQLKIVRNIQLAVQGIGSSEAIAGHVSAVPNVTSANIAENNTGAAGVVSGVNFTLPNAMWVCVAGAASDISIANALYAAHQGGCPWDYGTAGEGVQVQPPNGVQVGDPATGLPYFVKFLRPILLDVYVDITVVQLTSVASPVPAVQAAIIAYATGQEDGEPGLVVGASVSAFEMAGAVARQIPGLYIRECKVAVVAAGGATPAPGDYVYEFLVDPWKQGVVAINHIDVTVA